MRLILSLKTLLRTPVKTAAAFLLIALASFVVFSRILDYTVTSREMNKIENSYNGVIVLNNKIPETNEWKVSYSNMPRTFKTTAPIGGSNYIKQELPISITAEQMNAFSSLLNVTADTRYMTGGVIESIERLSPRISEGYDWGHDYTGRFIIEGTFEGYGKHSLDRPNITSSL
jgi:cell division protein FtsX